MSYGYCQGCSRKRVMATLIDPAPCFTCGSANFGWNPKPHAFETAMTETDRDFLRTQGIAPGSRCEVCGVDTEFNWVRCPEHLQKSRPWTD